ncbi:3409_t:CDS:2 [Cetraspora pellucida]|uniref:3409_t:CDS:1 n=1 Tax=Cetraspora pellucida TaxID=1433469 RepID=A0A9N8WN54_9GLOM|nr:3409_t:CDS:2 [Cetraspora pellucida]
MTQDLFNFISNESSVALLSKSTDISMTSEIEHVELSDDKSKSLEISSDLLVSNVVNNELKTTIKLGENPDKFVTITEKDKLNSIAFYDRMQTDTRICSYAKKAEEDSNKYIDILSQLSSYVKELANKLSNGKTKEQKQANTLIPIQVSEKHVDKRDLIKIIAQDIIKNNLLSKEINGIAYDLASSASITVAENSHYNLLQKKLRSLDANYLIIEAMKIFFITEKANQIQTRKHILCEINRYDCPEFFYLKKNDSLNIIVKDIEVPELDSCLLYNQELFLYEIKKPIILLTCDHLYHHNCIESFIKISSKCLKPGCIKVIESIVKIPKSQDIDLIESHLLYLKTLCLLRKLIEELSTKPSNLQVLVTKKENTNNFVNLYNNITYTETENEIINQKVITSYYFFVNEEVKEQIPNITDTTL